jgi:hypothetical protein
MQAKLATTVPLTADDLHALASDRGKAVRDYLIETGQIAAERLFLTEDAEPDPERKPASRVWLTLK